MTQQIGRYIIHRGVANGFFGIKAFLARLNSNGALIDATYLGSSAGDDVNSVEGLRRRLHRHIDRPDVLKRIDEATRTSARMGGAAGIRGISIRD